MKKKIVNTIATAVPPSTVATFQNLKKKKIKWLTKIAL